MIKGGPQPSEQIIQKVLFPIGQFHFYIITVPKQILPYHPSRCISWPVVNGVVVGPFEEEEEGTGVTSDVVKVEGEDPATPGPLP